MAHSSVVGGSTARLRRICPASRVESQGLPPEKWNAYAAEGSAIHKVIENIMIARMPWDSAVEAFTNAYDDENDITITDKILKEKVRPAYEFLHADGLWDILDNCHIETRMPLTAVHELAFGYGDLVFNSGDRVGLLDWKMGDNRIVQAEDNDQMRFYIAAAIENELLPVSDQYEAIIFQPSSRIDPSEYVKRHFYTHDDICDFVEDLHDAINQDPPRYVTGPHCDGCKGKIHCKEYISWLGGVRQTDMERVTTQELADYLAMIPSLRAFAKEVEEHALRNLLNGVDIPGWAADEGEGNSAWKEPQSAEMAMQRQFGIKPADRRETKLISPTKFKAWAKKEKLPPEDLDKFLSRHVVRPRTGPKLVKRKDGEKASGLARLAEAFKS